MDDDFDDPIELSDYAATKLMELLPELGEEALSDFVFSVNNAIDIYNSVKHDTAIIPTDLQKHYPTPTTSQHQSPSQQIKMGQEFIHHAEAMLNWLAEYGDVDNHTPSTVWNKDTDEPESNDWGITNAIVPKKETLIVDDGDSGWQIKNPYNVFGQLLTEFIARAEGEDGIIQEAKYQQRLKRRQQPSLPRLMLIEAIMLDGFNHPLNEGISMAYSFNPVTNEYKGEILHIMKIILDDIGEGGKDGLTLATIIKDVGKIKAKWKKLHQLHDPDG